MTCSSTQSLSDQTNSTANQQFSSDNFIVTEFPEHNYNNSHLSTFIRECVQYISGSIIRRVTKKLKCEVCLQALHGDEDSTSLTSFKSKGALFHPSKSVIKICECCEIIFKLTIANSVENFQSKLNVLKFTDATLQCLIDSDVFESLESHTSDLSRLNNHRMLLIKEIAFCFYQARIGHFVKRQIDSPSVRSICTKIPLFKGQ